MMNQIRTFSNQTKIIRKAVVATLLRAGPKGECEILYIKRKAHDKDRWGGQWAFPGGKSEPGETLDETCYREVEEEIGVDLADPQNWAPLGYISHRNARDDLVVHLTAFLQLTTGRARDLDVTRFTLNPGEISAAVWVPSRFFQTASVSNYYLQRYNLDFSSIHLPIPPHVPIEQAETPLWGLTLAFTQDLLTHFECPSPALLSWPPLEPRSPQKS